MMLLDQGMEVSVFDKLNENADAENINLFEELTDLSEEESLKYF